MMRVSEGRYTEMFRFEVEQLPRNTFHVLSFRGTEELSSLFEFEIELVSRNLSLDLGELLHHSAWLIVKRPGAPDAVFSGRPSSARQSGHFKDWAYYTVRLRPALWRFTKMVQSAIFLDKTAPEAADELLSSARNFRLNYQMRLTRTDYPRPEFAMQHEESFYDYVSWRMEQQGIYFYFAPESDEVIFCDSPQSHDLPSAALYYSPASGLEGDRAQSVVSSFSLDQTPLPEQVVVRCYDWKNPNYPIVAREVVSPGGFGDVYLAHEPAESQEEAESIARIRAQELVCRSRIFSGESASPLMRPGVLFSLERHYNPAFNRRYMTTGVRHEGRQEAYISLGLGIPIREPSEHFFYRNEFRCIEDDVQFRPERKAPRAKITGVMRAFIDGAGSGARAERDGYGRYKVVFPFDNSGRKAGNASCWIRMSQLQAGMDSGLALPVQPGTEALISFEEGDPDRPYISGVLANGETGSISNSGNQNISGLRTAGGNQITINDEDKKQGIALTMPSGNGIMMSAGSTDLAASISDTALNATSVMATDLAGILKTNLCGFRSKTAATTDFTLTSGGTMATTVSSMFSDVVNSLSKSLLSMENSIGETAAETASEGLSWGADAVKLVAQAVSMALQCYDMSRNESSYGVSISSSAKTSASVLQAQATSTQLVMLITSMIVRGVSSVEDILDGLTDDTLDNGTRYEKSAAYRKYTTSELTELIPEITSIAVLAIAASMQESKLGGLLLKAADENINLFAKRGITQHAGDGILLHAGTIPTVGGTADGLASMADARKILANKDLKGPGHWGVGLGDGESIARPLLKNDRTFLKTQNYDEGRVPAMDETPNTISSVADMVYSRAGDTVSVSVTGKIDHAGKFIVQSAGDANSGAATVMEPKNWATCVPGDGTVTLGVTEDGVKADEAKTSKLSGLYADKDGAFLTFKESGTVMVKDKAVQLSVKDGALLTLDKDAEMTADTISLKSGSTEQVKVNSSSVALCGGQLTLKNSEISANSVLQLKGSVIKIG